MRSVASPELALTLREPTKPILSPWPWSLAQRLAALTVLILLSPLFALLYVLVRATSRGPFLFRQDRRGLLGEPFTIYKIRTLSVGTERETALGVTKGSGQITRVGRLLRELKLDELPQLWNVVRGDMELVGPRPIPIALNEELDRHIPGFKMRGLIRPGLTNLSQVSVADNGVEDRLIADWTTRFEGELHAIRQKSVGHDLVMIAMTVLFISRRLLRGLLSKNTRGPSADSARGEAATLVAGVPIANLDYAGVTDRIASWVGRGSRYICICPVHSVVEAHWNEQHRAALSHADLNTADGMPVVWAQKLFGHRRASRVYGPTLMIHVLAAAERAGWRIGFYGGHPERNEQLIASLRERFPKLQIVEVISPPFRPLSDEENDEYVERLRQSQAEIVWVGIGCPRQEKWMYENSHRLPAVCIGVGAAFDFHAGAVRQAPALLQRLGLEWAFRLACEPRRLFRRYATTNPVYIWLIARQWLVSLVRRRGCQVEPEADRTLPFPATSNSSPPALDLALETT